MNVFRKEYRKLWIQETEYIDKLKDRAQELYDLINNPPVSETPVTPDKARALALAKTNFEQAIMWAVKGVTG